MDRIDIETQLRSKITSLESQVNALEEAKQYEKMMGQQEIVSFANIYVMHF